MFENIDIKKEKKNMRKNNIIRLELFEVYLRISRKRVTYTFYALHYNHSSVRNRKISRLHRTTIIHRK